MFLLLWAFPTIFLIFFLLRNLLERIPVPLLEHKAVLITGCDSGFGFELALRCLQRGMRVFAACLSEEGVKNLDAFAVEQGMPMARLHAFQMDVRSDESVARGVEFVQGRLSPGKGLHAVVNNAGISGNMGWDDWLRPDDYEQAWQVNTLGTIRVSQAFKRLVKMESGSRIVLMASACGRVALPAFGPYTVSKFAVEAYADTIRSELILFGVKVCILEPGFFRTPLTSVKTNLSMLERVWSRTPETVKADFGQLGLYEFTKKRLLKVLDPEKMNPHTEQVVDAYWHAISSAWPRRRYQVGRDMKWLLLPFSLLPAEFQDFFLHIVQFVEKPPSMKYEQIREVGRKDISAKTFG